MKILNRINTSSDVKKINKELLPSLCQEIRDFLLDTVSKTGGHLASNLGVVELTVAIHRVFDFPKDKIIFDVGHQSYVHKLLTGRRAMFPTLRRLDGLSGFPKRSESDCDAFDTGHSSTSVSAALGIATAQKLEGDTSRVIALFGDGALTGGMMLEALNMAGQTKLPLVLILNDNNMSISKNVGGLSRHLQKLRISPLYFKSKHAVEDFINKLPKGSEYARNALRTIKKKVRQLAIPNSVFDDLGMQYIGPIDGHDLDSLTACLEYAKDRKKPVLLHVITKKGMGYLPAMKNPAAFHGVAPFDRKTGKIASCGECYSKHFGNALVRLASENPRIIAITAAMADGTGLSEFAQKFPDRFFDVAIAEQHGVTFAAGLAAAGQVPVIPLYSSFLQRAYDQALHDVCLQNLHVVFPIDRAGLVGADGETHQGIYDISFLSHMPNMCILSPSSFRELDDMLAYAVNTHTGPIAIRYPRGGTCAESYTPFEFGRAVCVKKGKDVSVIASGRMVKRAEEVNEILAARGIDCEIIALPTVRPLDEAGIIETAMKTGRIITVEDNVKDGGMGAAIGTLLCENSINVKFKIFAFPDMPVPQGTIDELDERFGLGAKQIADFCAEICNG